ncbi:MAG: AraC family transcriptional regulator [Pseudomonadota bacterium]
MENDSISIHFVRSAIEPVIERGLDADALLRGAGIAPALLDTQQGRVTPQSFSALWLSVAAALDDELFAQDTRRMKVGSFAMLAQSLVHCTTLRGALQRMVRGYNLLLDDFHSSLQTDAGKASIEIVHTPGRRHSAVFGCETLLMMQHGLACWLTGRRIPIVSASFCYAEPSCSAEYGRMYGPELRFNQPRTALMFEPSLLDLPVIRDMRAAQEFVRQAPENILLKYKNSHGLAAEIRRRLRSAGREQWPSFEACAERLHMTPSTLRRRLLDEGESYQEIKDRLRREIAIDYLCHTSSSVTDIACELGFSEASAFQRAFKKWTGANPGEYRQRMLAA